MNYLIYKMVTQIKIVAILETSDHDGYCSGNECIYDSQKNIYILPTPEDYEKYPIGIIEDFDVNKIINLLPKENTNTQGSYYCKNSEYANHKELSNHDYRYTIVSVEIIQQKK